MTATSTASSIAGFGYDASQLPRSFRSGFAEATATSKSLQGVANATAIAEGRVARSTAIADGSSGSAVATSASIGVVDSIPSNDPISVGNTVTANVGSQTRVESYTATDGTMWSAGDISNDDAFSLLTLNPSASDVQSLFAGQNNFLDSQSGYEVVAVGRFGGGYPATGSGLHTFSINTEMTFNEEDFGGKDVFLSFDDFEATDNAFETLTLSLVADNFNFFRSFADRNEAQLFFTDNSVSLGSLSGLDDQFKMQIDWSSTSAADSFAANYGMSIRAVPEPHASVGILISGGIWFLRKRSRSRRRNGC
jgi:hypothetical protein